MEYKRGKKSEPPIIWSEAPKSMIQGSLEWTKDVRAEWLPDCATKHDPRLGSNRDKVGDRLRR